MELVIRTNRSILDGGKPIWVTVGAGGGQCGPGRGIDIDWVGLAVARDGPAGPSGRRYRARPAP